MSKIPDWMAAYYANSAGGSILDDYKAGRVKVVKARPIAKPKPLATKRTPSEAEKEAHAKYLKAVDDRDAAYWIFTRCKRGQPVPAHLELAVKDTWERLLDIRNGRT